MGCMKLKFWSRYSYYDEKVRNLKVKWEAEVTWRSRLWKWELKWEARVDEWSVWRLTAPRVVRGLQVERKAFASIFMNEEGEARLLVDWKNEGQWVAQTEVLGESRALGRRERKTPRYFCIIAKQSGQVSCSEPRDTLGIGGQELDIAGRREHNHHVKTAVWDRAFSAKGLEMKDFKVATELCDISTYCIPSGNCVSYTNTSATVKIGEIEQAP